MSTQASLEEKLCHFIHNQWIVFSSLIFDDGDDNDDEDDEGNRNNNNNKFKYLSFGS